MKVRAGFVSNSSSSSFIVIASGAHEPLGCTSESALPRLGGILELGRAGSAEFGWGPDTFNDSFSKINFAFLQSEANLEWRAMLEKVIKQHTNCTEIHWCLTGAYQSKEEQEVNNLTWGYVDHQSAACEGQNTELFVSEAILADFLFCPESYIELDNDNH